MRSSTWHEFFLGACRVLLFASTLMPLLEVAIWERLCASLRVKISMSGWQWTVRFKCKIQLWLLWLRISNLPGNRVILLKKIICARLGWDFNHPLVCCEWRCTFSNYVLCVGFTAVDFFNQVNLLYGTLTEFCTVENCPTMSAGPKYASWNTFSLQTLVNKYLTNFDDVIQPFLTHDALFSVHS